MQAVVVQTPKAVSKALLVLLSDRHINQRVRVPAQVLTPRTTLMALRSSRYKNVNGRWMNFRNGAHSVTIIIRLTQRSLEIPRPLGCSV